MNVRKIERIFPAKATLEGAGVHLKRGFGYFEVPKFDPFLLFDDFTSEEGDDSYTVGFPMHPHRGIETVTYILHGEVQHKDSMGNHGSIKDGDVQWMTAGSGIVHEEMPQKHERGIKGFQLWVNLPKKDKMMNPRYQEIKSPEIRIVKEENKMIKVIAGRYKEAQGPVKDLMVSPTYLDITLKPNTEFSYETEEDLNFFVYGVEGSLVQKEEGNESWIHESDIALLSKGTQFSCQAGKDGARFLLIGGRPIDEPVAWQGPIVMNTDEELEVAFAEYRTGTFVKKD